MNSEDLKKEYTIKKCHFELLEDEAKKILEYSINSSRIKIHSITSRIKTLESLKNKMERKQIEKPFFEIKDTVGIRVVCLFLSQMSEIEKIIKNTFEIIATDNKIEDYEDSSFGYMSAHYIVKMKDKFKDTHYSNILEIPFEIQVRTLSMDAWASISHHLDYKSKAAVPSELKKEFYALSGLLYIADTCFERFYKKRQQSRESIEKAVKKDEFKMEQEINLDTLTAYLLQKFPKRRQPMDSKELSELISELEKTGYKTLEEIDNIVDKNMKKFLSEEKEDMPSGRIKYTAIGVVRIIFRMVDPDFEKIVLKKARLKRTSQK